MNKRNLKAGISSRLEQVRKALGFSKQDMASRLGVQRPSYSRNEDGITFPASQSYYFLGKELNVSLDWLFCKKGSMFYSNNKPGKRELVLPEVREQGLPLEILELVEDMERVPLLRHELLAFYHRFKIDHPQLFE